MKSYLKFPLALFASVALLFTSCGHDDDHDHDHEGELITTLRLNMVPADGGTPVVATFRDIDGPGGQAPTQDKIVLKQGVSYNTTIEVLNESKTPAEDLTSEIESEGHEHMFFFLPMNGLDVSVQYLDYDRNNLPIGLETIITANSVSNGRFIVTLKHQPGTKSTTSTSSTGATDIEVNFEAQVVN
ncbi:hypothetical protein [Rufibacter roseus]|uniref:Type 1 periplasmic binding fold superfamily protein n=1 Tax=Rufibacter roseus TaxID=1567108 RepID=A0ABW2DII3_9BACT|nr:hypothetical protein [Rufibacter roseus]